MAVKGEIKPLRDVVFVTELEQGQRVSAGGIVIPDDNMKDHGIRARWGKVWKVGPEVNDLKEGEWILIKHGRWTFGIEVEGDNGKSSKSIKSNTPML